MKVENENCYTDFECEMNKICWRDTANKTLSVFGKCKTLYSLDNAAMFGHPFNTSVNTRNLTVNAGRLCKSGFAILLNQTVAKCMILGNITSNLDFDGLGSTLFDFTQ